MDSGPIEAAVEVAPLKAAPKALQEDSRGIQDYLRRMGEEGMGALKGLGQDVGLGSMFGEDQPKIPGMEEYFKAHPEAAVLPNDFAYTEIPGRDDGPIGGKVDAVPVSSDTGGFADTIKSMLSGGEDGKSLKVETDWNDENIISVLDSIKVVLETELGMMKGQRNEQRVQSRRQAKPGTSVDQVAVVNQVGPK